MIFFLAFIVLMSNVHVAHGVDRSKMKTCEQASFCARHREATSETRGDGYHVSDSNSLRVSSEAISVPVSQLGHPQHALNMEIRAYQHGVVRVTLDELSSPYTRYRVSDALVDLVSERITYRPKPKTVTVGKQSRVKINFEPFSLEFYSSIDKNASPSVHMNKRQMLQWEFYSSEMEEGTREEKFDVHPDSRPNGLTSFSSDVTFVGSQHVYGIPTHTTDFALPATRGTHAKYDEPYRMYNLDVFEYEINTTMALYGHVPLMVSHSSEQTVGFLWLNAAETWIDVDHDSPTDVDTHWISESGVLDVFFLPGPTPKDVALQYASLTGTAPTPPTFAIGYHQCKWNYKNEDDVRSVDSTFDEHNIPYDVIWLDIEHTDGKRYMTWDKTHFPTPDDMVANIASKGRKMVTIVDPHLKRDDNYEIHKQAAAAGLYVKDRDGKDYDGWCWPGSSSWPDFTQEKTRKWWAELFRYDVYKGSSPSLFTWNDMNEPSVFNGPEVSMHKDARHGKWEHRDIHNEYGQYVMQATAEGQIARNDPPNERPFVLSRAFFAGAQRFGAIWTGDNAAEWSHLDAAQPMLLSLGVAGISFAGADVGGFFGDPEPELLARWYQAAAFHPFFRGHAHLDSKRREPWLFGEPYTTQMGDAIRMRYALIPYLYTLFQESSVNGLPVMRPLWMEFPADIATFKMQDQFMLGPSILVHPVVTAGAETVRVYLPPQDVWYDYHSMARVKDSGKFDVSVSADKIPVYIRGGHAFARQQRVRRSTTQMATDPYTLIFALDANSQSSGSVYIDDGHSFDYKNGEFSLRKISVSNGVIRNTGNDWIVPNVVERIVLLGVPQTLTSVKLGGTVQLLWKQDDTRVVIRKPQVAISEDWTITFE